MITQSGSGRNPIPELCSKTVSDSACPPAQFVKYFWALALRPRHTSLGPHLGVSFNAHRQQHANGISAAYQRHTQQHIVFSTIFCVSSGCSARPEKSIFLIIHLLKRGAATVAGRCLLRKDSRKNVENTVCCCVCCWYAVDMRWVCCWRLASQRQTDMHWTLRTRQQY